MSFLWKDWNKADKTLLAAFAAFLMALATHLYSPGNRVAEGFLFCAEAALVGGSFGNRWAFRIIRPSCRAAVRRSSRRP